MADVVLPGRSYAEKEGTFSNTERRVQRIRKAVEIEGETKEDIWIFTEIMNRMGYPQPHLTSAQVMDEVASVTPSFAGISHERLDSEEVAGNGLQWHVPPRIIREHRSCMLASSPEDLVTVIRSSIFRPWSFRMRNILSR